MMDSWPPRKIEQDRASFHAIWLRFEVSRNLWIHVLLLFFVWRRRCTVLPQFARSYRERWIVQDKSQPLIRISYRERLINEWNDPALHNALSTVFPFFCEVQDPFLFDFLFYYFFLQTCYLYPHILLCLNNLHPPLNLILIDFQLISKST